MRLINYLFRNKELPLWFRRLNYISLAGACGWPLVFFVSLFMFDDPNANVNKRTVYWILINCYPIFLLILSLISYKLFRRSPIVAAIFPSIPIACYGILLGLIALVG